MHNLQGAFSNAEKLLSSSLNEWGLALATCDSLSPVWGQILCDPFLRRLLLRFVHYTQVLYCWFLEYFQLLGNHTIKKLPSSCLINSIVSIVIYNICKLCCSTMFTGNLIRAYVLDILFDLAFVVLHFVLAKIKTVMCDYPLTLDLGYLSSNNLIYLLYCISETP